MRQADYIYAIVPPRSEYGFQREPDQGDPSIRERVRSLASSFQWDAANVDDDEKVAIAVDQNGPPLVARIATDPHDPDGRLSLCVHVWIARTSEPLGRLIGEVWPTSPLPLTLGEFSTAAEKRSSGRVVVGPRAAFTAAGFDQAWGMGTPHYTGAVHGRLPGPPAAASERRPQSATRQPSSVASKFLLAIIALAVLLSGAITVYQYQQLERLRAEILTLTATQGEVERNFAALQKRHDALATSNQQNKNEIESNHRELTLLRSERQRLQGRIDVLESVIAENPQQAEQVELQSLRAFRDDIAKYIQSQSQALSDLKESIPQSPKSLNASKRAPKTIFGIGPDP